MKKLLVWTAALAAAVGVTATTAAALTETAAPAEPARVTSGGSAIYAWLYYTGNDEASTGYYELTKSGASMQWKRPNKMELVAGWLKDGKLCGYGIDKYGMTIRGLNYEEIDVTSGAVVKSLEMDTEDAYFTVAAYDSETKTIYGYGKDALGNTAFMKAESSDPTTLETVTRTTYDNSCLAMTWNPADGQLYGITKSWPTLLVTIDPATGVQTTAMTLNNVSPVTDETTGLVYAPVEGLFYWNKYEGEESYTSSLCTINLSSRTINQVRSYTNEEQFSVFVTTDKVTAAGQPAAPTITALNFTGASLSGSLVATMPAKDVDGNALSGSLDWTVTLDDAPAANGSAEAGATVTVPFSDLAQGNHTFAITASAGALKSEKAFVTRYIGNDTPLAPQNVVLTADELTWDAVTAGVNGGYLNLSDLEYTVYINGEEKATTKATKAGGLLPSDQPLTWYQATVTATCSGLESANAESNRLLAGTALNLPVNLTPTKEEFSLMQTFDLDGDSYSWKVRDGYMESMWSLSKKGGDDWVVLAPVNLPDKDAVYSIAYEAMRVEPTAGREFLEVRLGTEARPEAMTTVLMEKFEPLAEYTAYNTVFSVDAPGSYYIAFRATPAKYEVGLETGIFVRDIKIAKSAINDASPAAVSDLTAVRADKGALEATVSFKLPATTYSGAPLGGDVTATVVADETKTVTGPAGSEQSVTLRTRQGVNVISVTTSTATAAGTPATVEVYTGVVVPGIVENLLFTTDESMLEVRLDWDAPSQGTEPGYVDPAGCFYTIYEAVQSFYEMEWVKRGVTGPGVTTFTYKVEAGTQASHTLVVMAENVAGHGDEMSGGEVLLGTPFLMPLYDDFENGRDYFQYSPWLQYRPDDSFTGNWYVWPAENVVNDGEGNVLVAKPKEANSKALIGIPAVMGGEDSGVVELSFDVVLNQNTPDVKILASRYGAEDMEVVGTLGAGSSSALQHVSFKLPAAYSDAPWVQIYFQAEFSSATNLLIIDNVKVQLTEDSGAGLVVDGNVTLSGSTLSGLDNADVAVYSIAGQLLYSARSVSGSLTLPLPAGLYLLQLDGTASKLRLR